MENEKEGAPARIDNDFPVTTVDGNLVANIVKGEA